MQPKMIWANVAVSDLERTTAFYSALGFRPNGAPTATITSFLFGNNNFVLHFIIQDKLRTEIKGELADLQQGNEIIFTLSADSREEVDEWAGEVQKAGGKLVSKPAAFGDGYYGFVFADPDGHKFNVFFM